MNGTVLNEVKDLLIVEKVLPLRYAQSQEGSDFLLTDRPTDRRSFVSLRMTRATNLQLA